MPTDYEMDMITVQYDQDHGSIDLLCGIEGCGGALWQEVPLHADWPTIGQLIRGAQQHVREAHTPVTADVAQARLDRGGFNPYAPRQGVDHTGHGHAATDDAIDSCERPCSGGRCVDPAAHAEGAHDV